MNLLIQISESNLNIQNGGFLYPLVIEKSLRKRGKLKITVAELETELA